MPDLSLFHFIRPWALALIIPATLLYWLYRKQSPRQQGWAAIIDPHLLNWITPRSKANKVLKQWPVLLLVFWIVACLALAGPTWKKMPQPVFSSKSTQVILLDLSLSMDAADIEPSRLERAKFKIKDYLKLYHEGLTGLVVYAGDGFILSPLTSDKDTIINLLGALSTGIMPVLGSRPELGMEKAIELLDNSRLSQGKILWFTDGAEQNSLEKITEQIKDTPYQLNILALGTEDGAPIKLSDEEGFLKDSNGNIVIPQLDYGQLASFAREAGAVLTPLTVDNQDVQLMAQASSIQNKTTDKVSQFADEWFDLGYWLILLLLPLVLLSFKHRNLLGCLCLLGFSMMLSPGAQANPVENLFLNQNQQAKKMLEEKKPAKAYEKFKNPRWKALSAYRMGSYKAAESLLSKLPEDTVTADDLYNKANALALDGRYKQAIEAYDKALKRQPAHEDAAFNKNIIEQLQKQKQQKQKEKQGNSENQQSQKQNQQQSSQQQSDKQPEKNQREQQKQQQKSKQNSSQQKKPELSEKSLKDQFKEEEKDQELEQWLRRLPDDPGGLLRRKMYREYQRRGHKQHIEKKW